MSLFAGVGVGDVWLGSWGFGPSVKIASPAITTVRITTAIIRKGLDMILSS